MVALNMGPVHIFEILLKLLNANKSDGRFCIKVQKVWKSHFVSINFVYRVVGSGRNAVLFIGINSYALLLP